MKGQLAIPSLPGKIENEFSRVWEQFWPHALPDITMTQLVVNEILT